MEKFWNWTSHKIINQDTGEEIVHRVMTIEGTIAESSWFDDDYTPKMFKDELNSGSGDITVWINSPGGDCVAAAQIYNMLTDYEGNVTVKNNFHDQVQGFNADNNYLVLVAEDNVGNCALDTLAVTEGDAVGSSNWNSANCT